MPDEEQIFGKNEAEIEESLHTKLQLLAEEATKAATSWGDGWRNGRASITGRVLKSLDDKLEQLILLGLGLTKNRNGYRGASSDMADLSQIQEKALAQCRDVLDKLLTDDYVTNHKNYARILESAENEFWTSFRYKMQDGARKAGERVAEQTRAQFEKSLTTLIKQGVLDHFAASDGLAELAEEENRKNG